MTKKKDDAPISLVEQNVLLLVQQGLSNKEIGIKIGIEKRTVDSHLARCFKKLKVLNRVQAVRAAYAQGLLPTTNNSILNQLPNSD